MKNYTDKITLIKNSRGVYDLDTSKGCYYGMLNNQKGCYNDCYANNRAKIYGYKFNISVKRDFENSDHIYQTRKQLSEIKMPFVRIGVSGDPSHYWKHTIKVLNIINDVKKVVLITKHWINLTNNQIKEISKYNVIINTSVSSLDQKHLLINKINQYKRISNYCKSVLRIVSCEFKNSLTGMYLNEIQEELFNNKNVIDTVLRVTLNNNYVKSGLINIEKVKFLKSVCYVSLKNKKAYLGHCSKCPEMCGVNLN